jgi:DNA adenine methylase
MHKPAFLSDTNEDLVNTYKEVAKHPEELLNLLSRMPSSREFYNKLRGQASGSPEERAARFIYLNRNCYGGIYRENLQGMFNVPYGGGSRNHIKLCNNGVIGAASHLLSSSEVTIKCCDFEIPLSLARSGDVVYCDPTYRTVDRQHFDRYGKNIFNWSDQIRLSRLCIKAYERGSLVIVSNASFSAVKELYPSAQVIELFRRKGLGPRKSPVIHREYLLILDPLNQLEDWKAIGNLSYYKEVE